MGDGDLILDKGVAYFQAFRTIGAKWALSLGSGCAGPAVTAFHQGNECNE
jgi:hypothetical protein